MYITYTLQVWRQEKPTIAEESIAQAVLQWLEHRNADLNLAHQLLSCIRFGAVSPLALFELPEA
ncbi:BACK domain-containing protein, partial [Klebsiella pneumoniae]|nr:BACK domain-containing protein [Klebsiella pneumoniae]